MWREWTSVFVFLALSAPTLEATTPGSIRCKDQSGRNVDWFVMYKLPKMQASRENFLTPKGGEFVYVDSNTPKTSQTWMLSNQDIFDQDNPVAYTLRPLLRPAQDILYVVYNDQPPPGYNGTRNGHCKGVVLFDNGMGVWLLHSVPRFVEGIGNGRYSFPESGRENAQLLMCITLPSSEMDSIGKHLRMEYANVYARASPQNLLDRHPQMGLLFKESFIRGRGQDLLVRNMTSSGGRRFLSVAKRAILEQDIYSSILTGLVRDDLVVQSWRNGAGDKLPANCSRSYTVTHSDLVKLSLPERRSITFKTEEDHSKWAVAVDRPVFCIGSMNRMESQVRRGGEAVCVEDSLLSKLFRKSAIVNTGCSLNGARQTPASTPTPSAGTRRSRSAQPRKRTTRTSATTAATTKPSLHQFLMDVAISTLSQLTHPQERKPASRRSRKQSTTTELPLMVQFRNLLKS